MNPAGIAIRNGAVTQLLCILLLIGGLLSYASIGRLEDPEFSIKEALIVTHYPGATAEEVEQEVTDPLETAIQQLKQLDEVRSISRAGLSIIFAEIQETHDRHSLPQVWDELRRKVRDAAGTLPPDSGTPVVNDDFGDVYGVFLALTGEGYSKSELKEVAEDLRKSLLTCTDVGRIDFWGMPDEAVYIEIDRARLTQLGLHPRTILDAIAQQNRVTSAGEVRVGSRQVRLRVDGDYRDIDELGEQLVEGGNGRLLRIGDIATISRGDITPASQLLRRNGEDGIGLGISTVSGGNVIAMGEAIDQRIAELRARIPAGIEIHAIAHQGDTVRDKVQGFVHGLISAVVIVILLLVVFMGPREGLIVGAVLLLTIMATLLCMRALDITLQRISLGALIIALGMLVDNAIVVTEDILEKMRAGMERTRAAETTVSEHQWPLLGATGIAILAFAAISLSDDMTGEWLESLFQVICLSLGLSWLLAITVTPYLCARFLRVGQDGRTGSVTDTAFYRRYRRLVAWCLGHRPIALGVTLAVLVAAMAGFSKVQQDFMPDMNRDQFMVQLWLPEGTHIDRTAATLATIERHVAGLEGVTATTGFIGAGSLRFLLTYEPEMTNSAYAMLLVDVEDFHAIPTLARTVMTHIEHHHPEITVTADAFKLGPGGGAVEARLIGPEIAVLRHLAQQVETIMRRDDNARTVRTDWGEPVPVQVMTMARSQAQRIGVTRPEIAEAVAMNFSGVRVGTYRHGDDLLPILVRAPAEERTRIDTLGNVRVWSETNDHWVPLEQVTTTATTDWEDPLIRRRDRERTLSVLSKPVSGTTEALFQRLRPQIEQLDIPDGYRLEWGGEHEAATEANAKLMSNFPIAFLAMFVISVMLFNSLRHATVIFLGLPLVIVGVAPAMLLAGKAFGFMAMLGFLSLFGMLMKNEIVLLNQIDLERAAGKPPYRAVLDAAVSRVRPVTMAAFTTVLGMAPLLWDAFFSPMAVTIMGGLTIATVLTLIVVPVIYASVFRVEPEATHHEAPPGTRATRRRSTWRTRHDPHHWPSIER
ncbi:efflux RND transporter permease subunit [Marichromatium sp. AB31]|uniref:efflux RND transporter permease subunit n=1 Tax=Marichromatium sp. AB31 TaxID=2483362 RepID=UPI001CC1E710|nr:efflux RND transporter permease subunit [Marichromatium sp. AB31]